MESDIVCGETHKEQKREIDKIYTETHKEQISEKKDNTTKKTKKILNSINVQSIHVHVV